MKLIRTIAAAVFVAAVPGAALAAGVPVTPANQDAHYDGLFTSATQDCLDMDNLSGEERLVGCEDAMDEVTERREKAVNPSVAERANYDFYESLLNIAMASSYMSIDRKPTERVCSAAERSWTLHSGLLSIPKASLSPKSYANYHDIPKSVRPVLTLCRQSYGKPADGAELP